MAIVLATALLVPCAASAALKWTFNDDGTCIGDCQGWESSFEFADDAAEAVRITSIHRFKGLENRIVIVPDLARGERSPSPAATAAAPPANIAYS